MLSGKPVGPFFAGFQPILTNPDGPVRPPFYISHKLGRATKLAALSGDANGILGLFSTQIPKLNAELETNHAAIFVGGSNFGEVGEGQYKRLSKSGFRCE